jgi:hypothetical protein
MKNPMFQTLVYQYAVINWEEKNQSLLSLIDHTKFEHNGSFETDRKISNKILRIACIILTNFLTIALTYISWNKNLIISTLI